MRFLNRRKTEATVEEAQGTPPTLQPDVSLHRSRSVASRLRSLFLRELRAQSSTPSRRGPSWTQKLTYQMGRHFQSLSDRAGSPFRRRKVTLSVDKDVIRVVVFRGQEVLAWGTTQMESTSPDNPDNPLGDLGQGERLQTLMKQLGGCRGRAVTDLPIHAPLMRHLQIPKMRRRYLDQVVANEILETIPFSQEEVDLAWHAENNDEGHEVLAVATSKNTIDNHVKLLRQAGIRPRAAYSKAMALAHAADISDGVVIQLWPSHASFVLVRNKTPQAVYQVELDDKYTTPKEQAEAVARAVDEVAGYSQTIASSNGSQPLPVVLTGQFPPDSPLAQELRQALQREILPFAPPLTYSEHFSPTEYAANLGLVMADQVRTRSLDRSDSDALPSFNLLPERYLPRRLPLRPIAAFAGLLLLGALAFYSGERVSSISTDEVAPLSASVASLQRQERLQRLALSNAAAQGISSQTLQQFSAALTSTQAGLQDDLDLMLTRLDLLTTRGLPADVSISSISQLGDHFALSGTASSYSAVLTYMENLRSSYLFEGVRLQQTVSLGSSASPDARNISFQAKVLISPSQVQLQ